MKLDTPRLLPLIKCRYSIILCYMTLKCFFLPLKQVTPAQTPQVPAPRNWLSPMRSDTSWPLSSRASWASSASSGTSWPSTSWVPPRSSRASSTTSSFAISWSTASTSYQQSALSCIGEKKINTTWCLWFLFFNLCRHYAGHCKVGPTASKSVTPVQVRQIRTR